MGHVKGAALIGTVVSAALAAGAVCGPPTASASCASVFGVGITGGKQCTSVPTAIAIAIGTDAEAHAHGLLSLAVNLAPNGTGRTLATTGGVGNIAVNLLGTNDGALDPPRVYGNGIGNISINVGRRNFVTGPSDPNDFTILGFAINEAHFSVVSMSPHKIGPWYAVPTAKSGTPAGHTSRKSGNGMGARRTLAVAGADPAARKETGHTPRKSVSATGKSGR